jgi:hypothetical protein
MFFQSFFSKTFPQKSENSAPKKSLLGGHYLLICGKPYKMVILACWGIVRLMAKLNRMQNQPPGMDMMVTNNIPYCIVIEFGMDN